MNPIKFSLIILILISSASSTCIPCKSSKSGRSPGGGGGKVLNNQMSPRDMKKLSRITFDDEDRLRSALLAQFNERRRWHGTHGLEMNTELTYFAQARAEKILLYGSRSVGSARGTDDMYGEIIAECTTKGLERNTKIKCNVGKAIAEVIPAWYDAERTYPYSNPNPPYDMNRYNFMKMIWNGTNAIGFGYAELKKQKRAITLAIVQPGIPHWNKLTVQTVIANVRNRLAHPSEGKPSLLDIAAFVGFKNELLQGINDKRQQHKSQKLTASETLNSVALKQAFKILKTSATTPDQFPPHDYTKYSMLTYLTSNKPGGISSTEVINAWYKAEAEYSYRYPRQSYETNPWIRAFVEIISKSNTEIGIIRSYTTTKVLVVVLVSPGVFSKQVDEDTVKANVGYRISTAKIHEPSNFYMEDLRKNIKNGINAKRVLHDAGRLELDNDLNDAAQKRVKEILGTGAQNVHQMPINDDGTVGENIIIYHYDPKVDVNQLRMDASAVVNYWYSTGNTFNHDMPNYGICALFMQMVWKENKKIGIGFAEDENRRFVVLALFKPGMLSKSLTEKLTVLRNVGNMLDSAAPMLQDASSIHVYPPRPQYEYTDEDISKIPNAYAPIKSGLYDYRKTLLDINNALRAEVLYPTLTLDDELNTCADEFVSKGIQPDKAVVKTVSNVNNGQVDIIRDHTPVMTQAFTRVGFSFAEKSGIQTLVAVYGEKKAGSTPKPSHSSGSLQLSKSDTDPFADPSQSKDDHSADDPPLIQLRRMINK